MRTIAAVSVVAKGNVLATVELASAPRLKWKIERKGTLRLEWKRTLADVLRTLKAEYPQARRRLVFATVAARKAA